MILGTIQYPSRYGGLGEGVRLGLKYLAEHDLNAIAPGRHDIDGSNIFLEASEITASEPSRDMFEAHRKYLDIHVTLSGEEWFGHGMIAHMQEARPYDPETDTAYYTGEGLYLQSPPGHFILFMPEDAHKSGVYFRQQGLIRKIVLKVKL